MKRLKYILMCIAAAFTVGAVVGVENNVVSAAPAGCYVWETGTYGVETASGYCVKNITSGPYKRYRVEQICHWFGPWFPFQTDRQYSSTAELGTNRTVRTPPCLGVADGERIVLLA